ncbi:MAG: hypothetical protein L6V93_06345 [Clostridiales bacterium]|nr:MAG: hypothetical protein L6V93_06345 [Clostridiales bacterium]
MTLEEYFAHKAEEKKRLKIEAEKNRRKKEEAAKKGIELKEEIVLDEEVSEESLKIVKQDNLKVVDTRQNVVDLEKLDTEKNRRTCRY